MDNSDEDLVAKGATLYSNSNKIRTKRSRKAVDNPMKEESITDIENIEKIIKIVESSGLNLDQYKRKYVIRRTKSRIRRNNLTSFKEYSELLKNNKEELEELLQKLSINVTRFFRNKDSWDYLSENIITSLIAEKLKKNRMLSIWSAGCAVGAEPYTTSILLEKLRIKELQINITGTDFNEELLHIARNGKYSEEYLAEMDKMDIIRFFDTQPNAVYKIKDEIKQRVRFRSLDLTRDKYPKSLDLIICRNVLIYLEPDAQNLILEKFTDSLKPGGFLFLGRTETLSVEWRRYFEIISTRHRIYRKKLVIE